MQVKKCADDIRLYGTVLHFEIQLLGVFMSLCNYVSVEVLTR